MKLLKTTSLCALGLLLNTYSTSSFAGTSYKVDNHELPYSYEVVNQLKYRDMPSYPGKDGNVNWWLCGHAAFATAMNVLRNKYADHANQLEWFHTELSKNFNYDNTVNNPRREASGDQLQSIVNARTDGFNVSKITTTTRSSIERSLKNSLTSSTTQQLIALTKFNGYGHFVVVHEIYYDQNRSDKGYVKYADPYGGYASRTMSYTKFFDGMRDAGTVGRYSYWSMTK
ncbi:hypothetical protein [Pseudoalteromonas sp. MTN2-4]|uniref:hypothetical protein n=1 Tax=Pseudoalteromonas sp. MTN2-4 TaxID=3056555 RepID=UPI0036F1CBFB